MFIQWLITAATVGAFATCLYMWSGAEQLPERWHRLFRLGSWGAIVGAPLGAGAEILLLGPYTGWWELPALADPSHRLALAVGAVAGSAVACRLARLELREVLHMAMTCLSPYLVGLSVGAFTGGVLYSFFMLDAWDAPATYRHHVQHTLATLHILLTLSGAALFSLAFTGRAWRVWGAAVPEELDALASLELETRRDDGGVRA